MDAEQFAQQHPSILFLGCHIVKIHRDGIRDLIKQTSKCDGSATISVRSWLKPIGLAFDQVGQPNIIQVVTNTITVNLRFEVAR